MKNIITSLLIVFLFFELAYSRTHRINQIPNGSVNRCVNCHISSNGGGSLNGFGKEVNNNFLSGNNVVWNSSLANLDSDGDGFTNGQELQDPNGTWTSGSSNPGNSSMVSNPGNANSIPSGTSVEIFALKSGFSLISVSPNPVSSNSNINFVLSLQGKLKIELFNTSGMFISQIVNKELTGGSNSLPMKLSNLTSGTYFLKITFNNYSYFEKISIVK